MCPVRQAHDLMRGKVCLITGASSGIGLATARALAERQATVIVAGRNPAKTALAVTQIQNETGSRNVDLLLADLSLQAEVRRLAHEFLSRYTRLDVLINNAAALFYRRRLSADGIEMTYAVNCLAPYLLTNLLLDVLAASAPARVVNVSSCIHSRARLDPGNLQGEKRYCGFGAYARSKLVLLLFTYELARRMDVTQVTVNALHPGLVATNIGLGDGWISRLGLPILRLLAENPEEGARTSVYLATTPELASTTGCYFHKEEAIASAPASYDVAMANWIWEKMAQATKAGEDTA
jgi:NAD(P)-dependent dehydrogenase (short-subunit alcohol dehydrogenase family)